MGLPEKRILKQFIDEKLPQLVAEIHKAAKFEFPIEVDWPSLTIEGSSHLFLECWPKVYFQPLIDGFKTITSDEMGASALKENLKKVIIQNKNSTIDAYNWVVLADGVLTVDHEPTTNVDMIPSRTDFLVSELERKL